MFSAAAALSEPHPYSKEHQTQSRPAAPIVASAVFAAVAKVEYGPLYSNLNFPPPNLDLR
jgi:hypothetical protein